MYTNFRERERERIVILNWIYFQCLRVFSLRFFAQTSLHIEIQIKISLFYSKKWRKRLLFKIDFLFNCFLNAFYFQYIPVHLAFKLARITLWNWFFKNCMSNIIFLHQDLNLEYSGSFRFWSTLLRITFPETLETFSWNLIKTTQTSRHYFKTHQSIDRKNCPELRQTLLI